MYHIGKKALFKPKNIHSIEPIYIKYLDIIIAISFTFLFLFVFGTNRLVKETNILNVWSKSTTSIDNPLIDKNLNIMGKFKHNFAYRQGSYLHYYDELGYSTYFTNLKNQDRVSIGNDGYILYKRLGRHNEAYSKSGFILWRTNTSVYPEVSKYSKTIMNHLSDNSIIQMVDWNNNILSDRIQFGEFATDGAFANDTGDYAAGFSSGYIALIDRNGETKFSVSTILSEINFVKSIAISEEGSFIASLSGIRPEYLTLYKKDGSTIWYKDTKLDRRRNIPIGLSEHSMLLFIPHINEVYVYSVARGNILDKIDISKYNMSDPTTMKFYSSEKDTIFSLSKDGKSVVIVYDNDKKEILFEKQIDAWVYDVSISSEGDEYLIVSDEFIYAYKRILV